MSEVSMYWLKYRPMWCFWGTIGIGVPLRILARNESSVVHRPIYAVLCFRLWILWCYGSECIVDHSAFTECLEQTSCWWSLTRAARVSPAGRSRPPRSYRYNRCKSIISFCQFCMSVCN